MRLSTENTFCLVFDFLLSLPYKLILKNSFNLGSKSTIFVEKIILITIIILYIFAQRKNDNLDIKVTELIINIKVYEAGENIR